MLGKAISGILWIVAIVVITVAYRTASSKPDQHVRELMDGTPIYLIRQSGDYMIVLHRIDTLPSSQLRGEFVVHESLVRDLK